MSLTKAEAVDLLGRVTEFELAQLLALKSAASIAAGGPTLSLEALAQAPGGPVVVARIRITKQRPKRKAGK